MLTFKKRSYYPPRWIIDGESAYSSCCGMELDISDYEKSEFISAFNYCPNCGEKIIAISSLVKLKRVLKNE